MKSLTTMLALGLTSFFSVGCQETTTTGPSTTAPVKVTRPGEPNRAVDATKKLSMMAAESQSIKRGDTDEVRVMINRDNFNDPVTIRVTDLPQGVEAVEPSIVISANESSAKLTLKANDDAAVGEHQVKLVAEAPGIQPNAQLFTLNVRN